MGTRVEEGQPAPYFSGTTGSGETVDLASFRGRPLVLYFYPRDDTPGCTAEACGFRDVYSQIQGRAALLGVSTDSVQSHARFAAKHHLPFPLLSDPEHAVAEAYGVWVEKVRYGRRVMGVDRVTFLIDGDGIVRRVWRKVRPEEHAAEVLAALESLAGH